MDRSGLGRRLALYSLSTNLFPPALRGEKIRARGERKSSRSRKKHHNTVRAPEYTLCTVPRVPFRGDLSFPKPGVNSSQGFVEMHRWLGRGVACGAMRAGVKNQNQNLNRGVWRYGGF